MELLNQARHSHGIAEPNLSLSAGRPACMVKDPLGRPHCDTGQHPGVLRWLPSAAPDTAVA